MGTILLAAILSQCYGGQCYSQPVYSGFTGYSQPVYSSYPSYPAYSQPVYSGSIGSRVVCSGGSCRIVAAPSSAASAASPTLVAAPKAVAPIESPTAKEIAELRREVARLSTEVARLNSKPPVAPAPSKPTIPLD